MKSFAKHEIICLPYYGDYCDVELPGWAHMYSSDYGWIHVTG